jgi:aspartate racemase
MKTIGLIGGMSWSSTAVYYRVLNELVHAELGGRHSARLVLWSVDFAEHLELHDEGGWEAVAEETVDIGFRLRAAGADFLILCVNTLHKVADLVEERVGLPLLHIADATGVAIKKAGLKQVGLLGTRYTMGESFYRDRLAINHGIEVIIPEPGDFQTIDTIIFDELVVDRYEDSSRQVCLDVIDRMVAAGAEGVILGCTELPQLIGEAPLSVPTFDTLRLHAEAAVAEALA